MPNQTIAITLSWGAVATDVKAEDINQLGELIARQMSAAIRSDVTFIPQVTNDPATYDGQLIFNVAQNIFKSWDIATGAYVAVTGNSIGDVKNTFVGNDAISQGWIILNGRLISDISGLSGAQTTALINLFGSAPTARIPNVTPANVSGLPVGNAFGQIPWPNGGETIPLSGVFSSLPFSDPVAATEAQAFAGQSELLRDTTDGIFTLVKQIQAVCQQQLNALNTNTTPPLYAAMFIGF